MGFVLMNSKGLQRTPNGFQFNGKRLDLSINANSQRPCPKRGSPALPKGLHRLRCLGRFQIVQPQHRPALVVRQIDHPHAIGPFHQPLTTTVEEAGKSLALRTHALKLPRIVLLPVGSDAEGLRLRQCV